MAIQQNIKMRKGTNIKLVDFEKFCLDNQQEIHSYSIITDDTQKDFTELLQHTLRLQMQFDKLVVNLSGNNILLTVGQPDFFGHYQNYASFHKIKRIQLDEYIENLSLTFKILCGNLQDSNVDIEYVVGVHLKIN